MSIVTNGVPTLLECLGRHPGFRRLQGVLRPVARRPIWWAINLPKPPRLEYHEACKTCRFVRASRAQRLTCQRTFLNALARAGATRQPHTFICPIQRPAFVIPISQENQVTGYVAMCHSERPFPATAVEMATLAVGSVARELEKERELTNLYESIQPRCIALSTVHTIHRLINSTLNFDELLPRLARLCAQVLRARRCSIALVDPDRRLLILKAVAGSPSLGRAVQAPHPVERPLKIGRGVPGRVVAACQAYLRDGVLAVPLVDQECLGVIMVEGKQHEAPFTAFDQEILTTLAEQAVVAITNARLYAQQEKVALGTIKSLAGILDTLDTETPRGKPHTRFLVLAALAIADELGIGAEDRRSLHYAALLHDAGRVTIPDEILLKPTKLTGREQRIVERHPARGVEFMRPLEILEPAIPIILHHHERFDGRGYPKGLKGPVIPLGARIMAVANAFEAMICERPYREALTIEEAAREIQRNAGTQFDPRVVEAFRRLVRRGKLRPLVTRGVARASA